MIAGAKHQAKDDIKAIQDAQKEVRSLHPLNTTPNAPNPNPNHTPLSPTQAKVGGDGTVGAAGKEKERMIFNPDPHAGVWGNEEVSRWATLYRSVRPSVFPPFDRPSTAPLTTAPPRFPLPRHINSPWSTTLSS